MIFSSLASAQFSFTNTSSQAAQNSGEGVDNLFRTFLEYIPRTAGALVVMFFTVILAKIIARIIVHRVTRRSQQNYHQSVVILIQRSIYYGILVIGITIAFSILQINIATIVGFLGLGIGFAFKDLLANFIAGVVILTGKKFNIGDFVHIDDIVGTITDIDARTTEIKSIDGTEIVIPNAMLLTSVIQNYSINTFRRIDLAVGVHYNTNLKEAIAVATEAAYKCDKVSREPQVQVLAVDFAESSINLEVRFWIESTVAWPVIKSEVMQNLKEAFDANGITIPFPIRTLEIHNPVKFSSTDKENTSV